LLNIEPSEGYLSVEPSKGTAVETIFEIETKDWEDDDLPLSY